MVLAGFVYRSFPSPGHGLYLGVFLLQRPSTSVAASVAWLTGSPREGCGIAIGDESDFGHGRPC